MGEMVDVSNGTSTCHIQPATIILEDVRRAREFYRYLQPDNLLQPTLRRRSSTFDGKHDHIPSISDALAPYCQLAALRCDASKAMLNVMDRDVMYFLAEASVQRSNTDGEEILEFVADPILMSCSNVPLKGRICELTLRMDRPEDPDQVSAFVIPDLTKSPFAEMSIITGPPYYRFYAGVPITTRSGVNIGSIAIMDTKVRPEGLTRTEEQFLGKTAVQIMTYLETNRQAIEGRRSRQMAGGLEAFISGKKSMHEDGGTVLSEKTLKRRARAAYGIALESDHDSVLGRDQSPKPKNRSRVDARSNSIISLESEISSSAQSTDTDDQDKRELDGDLKSHSRIFARAANLLRESMGDLGQDGAVHFVSLATRLGGNTQHTQSVNGGTANLPKVPSLSNCVNPKSDTITYRDQPRARILASSSALEPLITDTGATPPPLGMDDDVLREMMRRHPGGRLWTLDESASSSSEDDSATMTNGHGSSNATHRLGHARKSSKRRRGELLALQAAFPHARQVLFTPVWDGATGSFAYGCFVSSALETQSFSSTTDLPFLNSFCSTVMAECSRLDTMVADRQKSDFVGTISHEMRSPLHGVLASVEFLADTEMTSFQRNLIETIDSCGRTLLDTINHVLDFSKVNSFQKQWQAANRKGGHGSRRTNYLGPGNSSKAVSNGAPPLLQLFGVTDISTVLEEVVDGLVLGHTYNSGLDITDTSREARGRAALGTPGTSPSTSRLDAVDIVLDVQHGDWAFMTQPGAVRRIIMNITGNAIKYTTQGTIHVRLEQKPSPENDGNTRVMVLTVTDTGKGISQEFLTSRLFVPFAQENALAPGTGLGLSIVRSIVLMLGGTIEVSSKVGKGTTIEVSLPMTRPLPGQVSTTNTPHSGGTAASGNSSGDDSILLLQNQAAGENVMLYRPRPSADDPLDRATRHYVKEWYGLEYGDQALLGSASVIIVEEEDLDHLTTKTVGTPGKRPALIVLCSISSKHSTSLISSLEDRLSCPIEFVARPCGPNKLARSIRYVLEKKRSLKSRFPQVANLGVIAEAPSPESPMKIAPTCDPAGNELQELDLSAPGEMGPVLQATETFAVSQSSHHAQMAIRDPSAGLRTPRNPMNDSNAFPFPLQSDERLTPGRERGRNISFTKQKADVTPTQTNGNVAGGDPSSTYVSDPPSTKIDPQILLVDDNKINLKLLETFLQRKRAYTQIIKTEDGQQAVDAVMMAREPYDIIFMDISMPVMNGFEATRAIRDFEEQTGAKAGAMIIALTGLASGRDQNEGFDSGCDIYMTKPVSFKEVGRLLDNWEGHQKLNMMPELSQGPTVLDLKLESKAAKTPAVIGVQG